MSDMGDKDRSRDRMRRDRDRDRDRGNRYSENSRDRSADRGRGSKSLSNRVYVSNIPYEYRWQDMKDLFRTQVGDVQFVELFIDDNDKPKGCGIVEFSDSASVKKCLEVMQRYEVKGRKLVVKEDGGNARDKFGNITGGGGKRSREDRYRDERDMRGSGGGGGGNALALQQNDGTKWGNTYGLSPHFLESLHIDAPLCNRVFVANLEYNVDKKKLKEIFRMAGKVIKVDLSVDKDGRSRGFAVVEFDHPVEAVQAISMLHNQVLFDRTMTVRMDRANDNIKLPEGLGGIGRGLGQNGEPLKNVAYNLPNSNNAPQSIGNGILGAVPNNALQVANALSSLNNVSTLGNLNSSVLNAANLGSLTSSLLQNGLGGTADLSSLVTSNPALMAAQTQQLSALTAAGGGALGGAGVGQTGGVGGGGNVGGRSASEAFANQPITYPQNYSTTNRASSGYQMDLRTNFGSGGMNSNMMKQNSGDNKGFSRKILISNLGPAISFKQLEEKLREFGDLTYWEEKGPGSFLLVYGSEWQAERAIKNLDKARVDGRYIDARMYY